MAAFRNNNNDEVVPCLTGCTRHHVFRRRFLRLVAPLPAAAGNVRAFQERLAGLAEQIAGRDREIESLHPECVQAVSTLRAETERRRVNENVAEFCTSHIAR